MATLYYAENVPIALTQTPIPTPHSCIGQESESKSVPESVFGNVNEPLVAFHGLKHETSLHNPLCAAGANVIHIPPTHNTVNANVEGQM